MVSKGFVGKKTTGKTPSGSFCHIFTHKDIDDTVSSFSRFLVQTVISEKYQWLEDIIFVFGCTILHLP